MSKRMKVFFLCMSGLAALALTTTDVFAQRGGRGGGGGGRSAGHTAPSAPKQGNAGPAMTRPSGGAPKAHGNAGGTPNIGKPGGSTPNVSKPNAANQGGGTPKRNIGAGDARPNGGFERPTAGNRTPPKLDGDGPRREWQDRPAKAWRRPSQRPRKNGSAESCGATGRRSFLFSVE